MFLLRATATGEAPIMDDRIASGCWTATVRDKLDRRFGQGRNWARHTPSQRLLGKLLGEHCDCRVEIVLFDQDRNPKWLAMARNGRTTSGTGVLSHGTCIRSTAAANQIRSITSRNILIPDALPWSCDCSPVFPLSSFLPSAALSSFSSSRVSAHVVYWSWLG